MNPELLNQLLIDLVTKAEFFCLLVNKNNQIIFANQKVETISCYSRTELIGTDYRKIIASGSVLFKDLDLSTLSMPFSRQTISRTKTNLPYTLELTISPVSSVNSEIFYAFTASQKLEPSLLEEPIVVKKANKKSTPPQPFISALAHEFKSPLNTIVGFSSLILEGMTGPITDEQQNFISRVLVAGEHLNSLVTDVREIFKIEAGAIKAEKDTLNIAKLTDELYKSIESQINQKQLKYQQTISPKLSISTDYQRLLQCLINLMTNAIKFSQQGTISLYVKEEDSHFVFAVSDQGIGISTENIALLFTPFIKIDSPLKQKAHGSGLNLYLTKKLVEVVLGGKIQVKSEINQGSTFYIQLPK